MAEQKRGPGRPPKARRKDVVPVPQSFEPDEEFGLTEMQSAFVFWYTEGACSGTEAARRAGFKNGAYNAAVSAVKELHNLAGLTVHRTQNLNINANLESMSKDDVRRRLNELLGVDESLSDKDR
jgi:hypothetical protein